MLKGCVLPLAYPVKLFVRFYYDEEKFRFPICSILPACFSRASANLWSGKGFARIGCSPDETCGATRPERGAMKCASTILCSCPFRSANFKCCGSAFLHLAYPVNCLCRSFHVMRTLAELIAYALRCA